MQLIEKFKNYLEKRRITKILRKLDSTWIARYGTCFCELPSFYLTHTPKEIEAYYPRLREKIKELAN